VKPLGAPALGFGFTETMKGFIAKGLTPIADPLERGTPEDYAAADHAGQRAGTIARFKLTITIPDLDAFLVDKAHAGIANGTLVLDGFTPDAGATVTGGVFNLFIDTESFYERKMLYLLPFIGADGKPYVLDGFKEVKDHGRFDVWGATSTLYSVVREGHTKTGPIVATGVLHIHLGDFMEQMTTFVVPGAQSELQRLDALARFGKSFMGTLWDVFVQPRLE
jgi:cholesterol oxidase